MDEKREPETGKREDFRRAKNASRGLTFRLLGAGVVLYWLLELIVNFFKGGPEAPTVGLLIVAIIVLGGGSAFVIWLSLKTYKMDKAAAEMTEEEIREVDALRSEDEAEEEPAALPEAEEEAEPADETEN